jgi:hypothetical protein
MKRGKKLLFVVGGPDSHVDFIYTRKIKMTKKWESTFDPLAEFQKIVRQVYGRGVDDPGNKIPGLLVRGEEDLPDIWESDFSLLGLVGIFDGGGPFEWEEVEDLEPGEPYRLSRLTFVPSWGLGSNPLERENSFNQKPGWHKRKASVGRLRTS